MARVILVVCEQRDGEVKRVTHEALSEASRLAAALGGEVAALLVGSGVKAKAAALAAYGAKRVFVADDAKLGTYAVEAYTNVAKKVCDDAKPDIILVPATSLGKDLAPRLAARIRAGLASDVIRCEVADGSVVVTRPIFAGKALLSLKVVSQPQVISLRPKVMALAEPNPALSAEVTDVAVAGLVDNIRTNVTKTERAATGRPDVSEADIIVSGGRGTKAPENFKVLEQLADLLGAAVGASRAAVDAGWRDHQDQVGQTGKTVTPNLYIACGISGAIQHLAGMLSSKCIVAINKDPEAPIFQVCDYGIVGDLFEIVPLFTEECRAVKSRS
ncbi:MAG TPA: electron transfer flavoprotein subunit alpha/FixB family protein [bacterium]|nr:electron transfer flavoprotein subunit alpha/FixB family protein [bacterium]